VKLSNKIREKIMNTKVVKHNREAWLKSAMRVAVIGLAALVLAACQPAAQPAASQSAAAPGQVSGGGGQRSNFQMSPAAELPTTQSAVRGLVVKIDGNMLTVMEGGGFGGNFGGGTNGTPRPTPDGTPRAKPTPGGGTEVQVDVSNAQVYQDVTFANLNGQPPSGTVQQKVEASSLDKVVANSRVTIWGDQNGDQITAKVIVYTQARSSQPQQP
jgi:hypothetical protein